VKRDVTGFQSGDFDVEDTEYARTPKLVGDAELEVSLYENPCQMQEESLRDA